MANTITIQDSINYASTFIRFMNPTTGVGNEPALTIANTIAQTVLSAPFTWACNRGFFTFQTIVGQQDYSVNQNSNFIETASLQPCATITEIAANGTTATITCPNSFSVGAPFTITGLSTDALNGSGVISTANSTGFTFASAFTLASQADSGIAASGKIFQIKNILNNESLSESSDQQRPESLCALQVDADTTTIRFLGVPDNTYNVRMTGQDIIPIYTGLSDLWSPTGQGLTDNFCDIFNAFFVGYCMEYAQDARADKWLARGAAALIRKSEGLSEMDKAIFMAAYIPGMLAPTIAQTKAQQGNQARGQG